MPEDTWWGTQAEMFGPRNAHRLGLLFEALDAIAVPSRILDAAVGLGDVAERLRQRGHWVVGVDLSTEAAVLARGRTGAHIVVANLTALPFRSGVLDVVISSETLEHIEDDLVALREFSRVLQPRGKSVVTVPAIEGLRTFSDDYYQHLRRYSRPALVAMFREAGFRVVFAHYWGFPFVLLYDYLFMVPLNKRRARRGVESDSMLRGVRSAGRMRWLVRAVSGLFAADRLWPRLPFGVGIILSAVKSPGDGTA
jgi:SAM-dependent methyltransferase